MEGYKSEEKSAFSRYEFLADEADFSLSEILSKLQDSEYLSDFDLEIILKNIIKESINYDFLINVLRILLYVNPGNQAFQIKKYLFIITKIINKIDEQSICLDEFMDKFIELISNPEYQKNYPTEIFNLIECFKNKKEFFEQLVNNLLVNFSEYSDTTSFNIMLFNSISSQSEFESPILFKTANWLLQNFCNLVLDEQLKILKSLKTVLLANKNFIFLIKIHNYVFLFKEIFQNDSIKLIQKGLDFFLTIRFIETQNKIVCKEIWENVFSSISISKYKKIILKCIHDVKSFEYTKDCLLFNFIYYKDTIYTDGSEDDLNEIEEMLTSIIEIFPNISAINKENALIIVQFLLQYNDVSILPYNFIKQCIESFALEKPIFPEFIIYLIEKSEIFGKLDLISILNDSNIESQLIENFPDSRYSEIIISFIENK